MSVSYYEIGGVIQESVTSAPQAQTAPSAVLHSSPIFLDAAKRLQRVSHAKRVTKTPSIEERGLEKLQEVHMSHRKKLGATMMRWSVGGALLPDPIPLVDELLFAGTFAVGAYLYATSD